MKTLRKSKLLGLFLAAFMALTVFFGILFTIPRSASADTNETFYTSRFQEVEYDGTAVAGRYFKITPYDRTSDLSNNNLFLKSGVVVLIRIDDGSFTFRDCGADKMLSLEEVGLEIVEATSKHYVLYFAEDFKFTSTTGDSSLYFDATVDGIEMAIDLDMNCYTTELIPETLTMDKIEYDGTAPAGRYFRVEGGSNNAFSLSFDKANVALYISTSGFQLIEKDNYTFHALQEEFAIPKMIRCYNDETTEGSNYIFEFYIPEGIAKANNGTYSIDFNAEGFTVDTMVAEGFYELVNPKSNPSGSGGSSVNQNNKTNNVDELDVLEIIALVLVFAISTIIESIYVIKVPNSKAKWIMLLVLIAGLAIAEGALYMYFIGTI